MPAYYVIIQYVPDPVRDERINFGVICYDDKNVRAHFIHNWRRIQHFSGGNIAFLKDFAHEIERSTSFNVPQDLPGICRINEEFIRGMAENFANSIQVTEPRGSLADVDTLLANMADRFLVDPGVHKLQFRTRSTAARIVHEKASSIIQSRFGVEGVRHYIKRSGVVTGKFEPHEMDVAIGNGTLKAVLQGLSFEGPDSNDRDQSITKTLYSLQDILGEHPKARAGVMVLAPASHSRNYERAMNVLPKVGATILNEQDIEFWTGEISNGLPPIDALDAAES